MLPCGFAAGIAGALPQAGAGAPPASRRAMSAAPPISATTRAKISEKFKRTFFSLFAGRLAEACLRWNRESSIYTPFR